MLRAASWKPLQAVHGHNREHRGGHQGVIPSVAVGYRERRCCDEGATEDANNTRITTPPREWTPRWSVNSKALVNPVETIEQAHTIGVPAVLGNGTYAPGCSTGSRAFR